MKPPPPPPPVGEAGGAAVALPALSRLQELSSRGLLRRTLPLLGPAFVAAIAYVDPGNFATNIAGGASRGYLLLWVILLANLMGMLIQNLSAKVGIATGRNLAELCREHQLSPSLLTLWKDNALERLQACGLDELIVTNSIPIPPERRIPQLTVLSIGPIVALTIKAVFEDESVSEIFQGENQEYIPPDSLTQLD